MRLSLLTLVACAAWWAVASGKAALSLNGDNAVVDFYPAFSIEESDCFGTTCTNERVFNLFIDRPASGEPLCDWADAKVQNGTFVIVMLCLLSLLLIVIYRLYSSIVAYFKRLVSCVVLFLFFFFCHFVLPLNNKISSSKHTNYFSIRYIIRFAFFFTSYIKDSK
jgi:hypothetical protein